VTVELLPLLLEKFRWRRALRIVQAITIPVVIAGCILSTLHQSSLGALFLIVSEKMWPISYLPLLPLYFLISAVAVGLAVTIVESNLSARAFQQGLDTPIIISLARVIPPVIILLLTIRVADYDPAGCVGAPGPAAISDVHLPVAHSLVPSSGVRPVAPALETPTRHSVLGRALGGGSDYCEPPERGLVSYAPVG
jgi:hypothetical protein